MSKKNLLLIAGAAAAIFFFLKEYKPTYIGIPNSIPGLRTTVGGQPTTAVGQSTTQVRNGDKMPTRDDYSRDFKSFNTSYNGDDISKIGKNSKGVTYWLNGKKVFAPYGANGQPDYSQIKPVSKLM